MRLLDTYQGGDAPFAGSRTLWLRSLPAGARVTKATVTLAPAEPSEGTKFEEIFTFEADSSDSLALAAEEWGVTKTGPGASIEVDFHARRTLAGVEGSGGSAELQVDMGGAYIGVADDGTFNPDRDPWPITLAPNSEVSLPGLTVSKFKLSQGADLDVTKIRVRSTPTNVSVRLGQIPPFWTHVGELATAQTSSEFADVLNAFLSEATAVNGFYAIPIVIHSDTITRLNVTLIIDYVIEQPVLPSHLPEVTIPYGFSTLPGIAEDLLTVALPRGAQRVVETSGAVQGTFEDSRVISGAIGEIETTDLVTITPGYSLAQPIQMSQETPIGGIDLPLANTEPGTAGLHLALQTDSGGKPSGDVLTSAEVVVTRPVPGGSAWGSATLATEFRFLAGERYWLVLQSLAGQAQWGVRPGELAGPFLLASTDDGFSWRMAATETGQKSLTAFLRLRHTPERFTMPLRLQIGQKPDVVTVKFDRFESLGRVEFGLDFAAGLEEYVTSKAVGPACGSGEQVVNGRFQQPPHDDATRRLFEFDAIKEASKVESVDLSAGANLSRERFIFLSVDDSPPTRIDCAGSSGDPARARVEEIIGAIREKDAPWHVEPVLNDDSPPRAIQFKIRAPGSPPGEVTLHPWRQEGTPQGWQQPPQAGGRVWRAKWPTIYDDDPDSGSPPVADTTPPPPERLIVGLEPGEDKPAVLAQRITAASGCVYNFSFFFQTRETQLEQNASLGQARIFFFQSDQGEPIPDLYRPSWEIRWLDAAGQRIDRERQTLGPSDQYPWDEHGMQRVEVRLVAPPKTAQAEIRFTQPPYDDPAPFILDDVSFKPVLEALRNSDFVQATVLPDTETALAPLYWDRQGGRIQLAIDEAEMRVKGVELNGNGIQDTALTQVVDIAGGARYELEAKAYPESPRVGDLDLVPDEQRARIVLRWLKEAAPVGDEIVLPLDALGFPTHAWAGDAPAEATQAEVRVIQPRGMGSLLVESVYLVQVDMVSVPLVFLAEAPGELVVSNPVVVYDPPTPPAAPELFVPLPAPGVVVSWPIPPWTLPWRPPIIQWPPPLLDTGIILGPGNIFERLRFGSVGPVISPLTESPVPVEAIVAETPSISPLAGHSANAVAGVSDRLADILGGLPGPVTTIAELAALDPATEMDISRGRLLTLKSAAELIMDLDFRAAPFSLLAEEALERLLTLTPVELAQRAGQSAARAEELQRDLRALRLLLNNDAFGSLRLVDLIT